MMDHRLLFLLGALVVVSPSASCQSPVGDVERAREAAEDRSPLFFPLKARTFTTPREDGWISDRLSLMIDTTAPAGPAVGQMRFPAGWPGGYSPGWSDTWGLEEEGLKTIYLSFWIKLSDNWQGHPVVSKIGFVWMHDDPVVVPLYRGEGRRPLAPQIWIQDVPDGARRLPPNLREHRVERGKWHHWEILLVANEGDEANGEVHYWVDGLKLGAYDDVRFGTADQSDIWERVSWRPVWGGVGGATREDMYMRMAEIVVGSPWARFEGPHR